MTSWREVAEALARRMLNHAYCPEDHDPLDPECPFCQDKEAYMLYLAKRREKR